MGKLFGYADENSNIRTEILAGITTFLTTMYIIVVNPSILSAAGMPFNGVLTATALVSAFSSILMGLYAKNPIVVAPGMGLNAFLHTPWFRVWALRGNRRWAQSSGPG